RRHTPRRLPRSGHRKRAFFLSGSPRAFTRPKLGEKKQVVMLTPDLAGLRQTSLNIYGFAMRICYAKWDSVPATEGPDGEGFEPPVPFGHTRSPGVHNQPLCHPSRSDSYSYS